MARSILRREVSEGRSPAAVLAATSQAMFGDLVNAELFITMFSARYEPAQRRLVCANAGHNPPLLARADGTSSYLEAEGPAVGFFETSIFEEVVLDLAPHDVFLLYTDGVVEAAGPDGEQFGEERLRQLLARPELPPPDRLTEEILAAVRSYTHNAPHQDDITLAGLQVLDR
jgi:sigma-B regulation protein RsbU (phosphoserine phosphatase)